MGLLNTLDKSAQYWQERAARLPKGQRVLESIHPLYAFGHAMGGMRAAAQQGDKLGMALNGVSAMPMFGWVRAARAADPLLKGAAQFGTPAKAGLRAWKANLGAAAADNAYGSSE